MNTDFTDIVIAVSAVKRLPKGSNIIGHDTIKNPFQYRPSDPDIINVLVIEVDQRTCYYDFDGKYIGDI